MRKRELIFGLLYLPLHIFAMPFAVGYASYRFLPLLGVRPSDAQVTLLYYFISLLILLFCMRNFLKDSFSDLIDRGGLAIRNALLGYVLYIALLYALSLLISYLSLQTGLNPNTGTVQQQVKQNSRAIIVASLLLAPLVEETLFRGVVFGLIRKKNRYAAYAASYIIFAVYHVWQYAVTGLNPAYVFYILQYLPGSLVLAWSYEKSGTIWSPVLLHMLINGVSIYNSL